MKNLETLMQEREELKRQLKVLQEQVQITKEKINEVDIICQLSSSFLDRKKALKAEYKQKLEVERKNYPDEMFEWFSGFFNILLDEENGDYIPNITKEEFEEGLQKFETEQEKELYVKIFITAIHCYNQLQEEFKLTYGV